MKLRLLFIVFIFLVTILKGQSSIDRIVFENVCELLEKENNRFLNKSKIMNIDLKENWETGEIILDTINPLTLDEKQFLSTVTKEDLIHILLSNDQSIFPLGHHFLILDTIGFFSDEYKVYSDEITYKIVKKNSKVEKLSFWKFKFKDDQMIVGFKIANKTYCQYLNCYFKSSESHTTLELIDYKFGSIHCQHLRCEIHYIEP